MNSIVLKISNNLKSLMLIALLLVMGVVNAWGTKKTNGKITIISGKGTVTITSYYKPNVWTTTEGASGSISTVDDSSNIGKEKSVTYDRGNTQDGSVKFEAVAGTGYTFYGWCKNSDCSDTPEDDNPYTISKGSWTDINETRYTKFTANSYTVTLKPNGATTGSDQVVSATYDSAMPLKTTAAGTPAISVPTKTGYTLVGYYDTSASTGGTQYYTYSGSPKVLASAREWNVAKDTNLYARWTANAYTITLNNQSATTAGTTSITATYDANTNLTSSITRPEKTSNVFDGYYTAINGGGTKIINSDGSIVAGASDATYTYTDASKNWKYAGNITLYANWISKYTPVIIGKDTVMMVDGEQTNAFSLTYAPTPSAHISISSIDAVNNGNGKVISYDSINNKIIAHNAGVATIYITQAGNDTLVAQTSSVYTYRVYKYTTSNSASDLDTEVGDNVVSGYSWTYTKPNANAIGAANHAAGTPTLGSSSGNFYYTLAQNVTTANTNGSPDGTLAISYNASTKTATGLNAGTGTVTLVQKETYKYATDTLRFDVDVTKKSNAITCSWGTWSKDVNFDSETGVTFTSNNDAYAPIVVTQTTGDLIASYDDDNDKIVANFREGTARWSVSQAEDYKYEAAVTKNCTINVGTISSPGCYVLENQSSTEYGYHGNTYHEHTWSAANAAGVVRFEISKNSGIDQGYKVQQKIGSEWVDVTDYKNDHSTSWGDWKTETLNRAAKGVRFMLKGGSLNYVRNVSVSKAEYVETKNTSGSAITSLTMPSKTRTGDATTATFYVDYSTCDDVIKLASNNSHITFANGTTSYQFSTENAGRKSITLTYDSDEAEEIEATIAIYTQYDYETLTVNAETKGKLATTLEYIGEGSYNVNHANLNATDLFQVRDENGDLVASPVIKLNTSDATKIDTVNNKTAIDFLCGGSTVTITASYAGDATYAAASNLGQTITVNKLSDDVTWNSSVINDTLHVWADRDIAYSIASANTSADKKITFSSNDATILRVTPGVTDDTLRTLKHDTVRLTATTTSDCTYASKVESIVVVVDPCRHDIVWNQNFKSLMTEEDGTIDQTIDLTAYAVDSNGVATNKAITYTLASTTFASIVDGTKLRVTGTGQTIITASTAADNKYDIASASLQVRVRTYGAGCSSEVTDPDKHNVSGYTNKNGLTYAIPPSDKIYVKVGRQSSITCDSLQIIGYDENEVGTLIKRYNPSELTDDGADKEIPIEEKYRKIKFIARGETGIDPGPNGGTQYKWFSNLRITQKSYLRSSRANITNDRVHVYDAINETVVVSYSDKPLLNYRITGSHLTLTPSETVDNDCGDFGSYTFTVRGSYTTSGRFRDTIYITTTALDTLRIPIEFTVSPGTELYFQTSSGSWNTETKWTNETGVVQDQVPAHDNRVVIREAVTIDCQAEAYKVTIGEGGSVTIVPGGGLSVGAGGIDGATPSNLIIQAGTEGATKGQTGYLRIAPEYAATMPQATVQFYSIAYHNKNAATGSKSFYQCIGAPISDAGVMAKTVFGAGSYLYTWNESTEDWTNSRTSLEFTPFKGFEVTQKKSSTGLLYSHTGHIVSGHDVKTIDLDYTSVEKGYNLLANSWTAPIDISQFESDDFVDATSTIYILNAGTKNNSDNPGESVDAPGKWIGVPIKTAAELAADGLPRVISSMQGFWVKANSGSAQLKLDYSRLVWGVNYSGYTANKPLRVQQRDMEEEDESRVEKMKINIYGAEESDVLYMLESNKYDKAYEDGYDAYKVSSEGLDLYSIEEDAKLSVDATYSISGTALGLRTGDETAYTFRFTRVTADKWALWDIETGQKIDINEGTEYTFFTEPDSEINGRFMIIEREEGNNTTTQIENTNKNTKGSKFIKNDCLYILKDGKLYDTLGRRVR